MITYLVDLHTVCWVQGDACHYGVKTRETPYAQITGMIILTNWIVFVLCRYRSVGWSAWTRSNLGGWCDDVLITLSIYSMKHGADNQSMNSVDFYSAIWIVQKITHTRCVKHIICVGCESRSLKNSYSDVIHKAWWGWAGPAYELDLFHTTLELWRWSAILWNIPKVTAVLLLNTTTHNDYKETCSLLLFHSAVSGTTCNLFLLL